ncbi:MAG TPA: TonB-dependent siderophore receptor [Vicinamibacterales bacterium]|nr:TonB-dependent siderophore receptor [Vicinamibacterales bacterium]
MKNRTFSSFLRTPRRRRGRSRLFVLGAAFVASTAGGGKLAYAQQPRQNGQTASSAGLVQPGGVAQQTHRFDIPAGTIETVSDQFRTLTGIRVVIVNEMIKSLPSPGVAGVMTGEQALEQMLAGTSVGFVFTARDAVSLDIRTSEQLTVTGRTAVVASPKYTAPPREVPQTIALITREVIEEQGATTLSEALRNVPGITLQAGEGGGASNTAGDMFNMRGFNAANSLFVDGVRDDGLISRDVFNLEQIEVFMGPTGSDVGRGTAAGYVNMHTKSPYVGTGMSVNAGFGSAEQGRLSADFNWSAPATATGGWLTRSGLRLNALWQNSGVPGRDVVENETRGIAPSFAMGLGTPTRVVLAAQFVRQDNLPDYGIPGAAWEEEPLTPTTIRADSSVAQTNYYGSASFDYDEASQDAYTARIEHDVNRSLTLRNQTRYNRTHREAVITTIQNVAAFNPVTNLVTLARQGNERENEILSNQTSLVDRFSTGRFRHAVSAGLEVTAEQQFAPTLTGVGTRAPANIYTPDTHAPVAGYDPARTSANSRGRTSTVALYAFDTIDLATRWQVSGGLRWEHYETDFTTVDAAGATTVDLGAADQLVSGKVGVVYRATENGNVYVSYGTTVTPPGSANFTLSAQINNVNNPSLAPQESSNFEVGTKWDVANGRLSLTGAVFHTRNRNVIYTVDATVVPPVFNQDDAQRVNGITVGAMGRIGDRWEVLANAGFLDTALESQDAAINGNHLTLTPRHSGSVWTTYRAPIGLRVGGGVRYTDDVFINTANTIRSPGYHVIDGLVEYDVNTHLTLRLNLYNLTDEVYIRNVNNNGARYNPGYTRSAMFTTNVRF